MELSDKNLGFRLEIIDFENSNENHCEFYSNSMIVKIGIVSKEFDTDWTFDYVNLFIWEIKNIIDWFRNLTIEKGRSEILKFMNSDLKFELLKIGEKKEVQISNAIVVNPKWNDSKAFYILSLDEDKIERFTENLTEQLRKFKPRTGIKVEL